jgi:ATP-dependent Clp protease ATP-binding subunit ClpC
VTASAPTDVFVHVRAAGTDRGAEGEPFAAQLADMYVGWARSRGMRLERVDAPPGEHLLAVSGLGCGEILGGESGLHVLEHVDEARDGARIADREHVLVHVLARVHGPEAGAAALAREALRVGDGIEGSADVVRRYRAGRAPLVRDTGRGYRTGRLDRVLAGDFDLY